ncbi:SulP family inorganic anion transporter [Flectobacillus roseus]|uniref:SulP family inorganic anion transporter n=1 Tax=Flectobacillus roseus TaxID=502259 RepID=A0ABT6YEZ4_9BACT|nr:SulP family inorganic anion transporter [Flectobacillus roseus]MDI9862154.1 SulP family inorganic anion transporter [Flectobacillus roseus]
MHNSVQYYKDALFKSDWKSGLSVFLVALPLCLGIALASGAPLFSGILAGIVAGTFVALLSGSEISVSGPAAGLTVIVATAIHDIGSFQGFLVAVVLAGVIQLALGLIKAGKFSAYFPESVIRGMLVAIGIVIILKQIPHALGDDQDYEGEFEFEQVADHQNTITELIRSVVDFNYGAVTIAIVCLAVILLWERAAKKYKGIFAMIPAALVTVLVGTLMNEAYRIYQPFYYLGNSPIHMVNIPKMNGVGDFVAAFSFPDFSALMTTKVYIVAFTLAIVASLETLLNLEASDAIDPQKRQASPDKELVAQGIGNMISGLIGGLPITSVVVRTSANVYSGARTRMSSFVHGMLLLGSVLLIPNLLNKIPLSSLAAVLLTVGYKLAHPKVFVKVFKEGYDQWIPFVITILVIVFKDLLFGIFIGTGVGLIFVLFTNFHSAVSFVREGKHVLIQFNKDVSFLNKPKIKQILLSLEDGDAVYVDATKAQFIDHDIYNLLYEFKAAAYRRNIEVDFKKVSRKIQGDINQYLPESVSAH